MSQRNPGRRGFYGEGDDGGDDGGSAIDDALDQAGDFVEDAADDPGGAIDDAADAAGDAADTARDAAADAAEEASDQTDGGASGPSGGDSGGSTSDPGSSPAPPGGETAPDDDGDAGGGDTGGGGTGDQGATQTDPGASPAPPGGVAPPDDAPTRTGGTDGPTVDPGASAAPPGGVAPPDDDGGRTEADPTPAPDTGQGYSGDPNPTGGIGPNVPARARGQAVDLRQEAADQWYGAVGPEDIMVTFDAETGQLEAELTASGRRELGAREAGVEPEDIRLGEETVGTGTSPAAGEAPPGGGGTRTTTEPRTDEAMVEIAAANSEYSESDLAVSNGELVLTGDARREAYAEARDVAPEDVELVPAGTTGTSPVGGEAPPEDVPDEARLTDEAFAEETAERSPDIAGIGTVETVQTPGGREVQLTEAERQRRRQEAAGPASDVTVEGGVGDAFGWAGDRFEPVAEGAAAIATWQPRTAARIAEGAGVPGARTYRGGLQSFEEGLAEAANLPRAGADVARIGEAGAYATGAPRGTPDTGEAVGDVSAAGQQVGKRAVQGAVSNPVRTTGAVVGGVAIGAGATRAAGAGVRGASRARSGAASGSTTSSSGAVSRVRGTASEVADRAPVEVIRDPDAPLVEVTPEVRQAVRGAPGQVADTARGVGQRAVLGARRARRDLRYVDPITDARTAARVGAGRASDRIALGAQRVRRDVSDATPVTDARAEARVAADRLTDARQQAGGRIGDITEGAQAIPGRVADELGQRAAGSRFRQSQLREQQLRGVEAGEALIDPASRVRGAAGQIREGIGSARSRVSYGNLAEGSPLAGDVAPTTVNVRYFESDRPGRIGRGAEGFEQLHSELADASFREGVRGVAETITPRRPSVPGRGLTDYSLRIGSRPPRRPGYDLGEVEEGRLVEVDLTDSESVSVTPRSEPARRFRDEEGADVGSGQIQATEAPEQQAVQLQRAETEQQIVDTAPDGTDLSRPAAGTGLATTEGSLADEAGSLAVDQEEVSTTIADETATTEVADDLSVTADSLSMTEEAQQSEVTQDGEQDLSIGAVTEPGTETDVGQTATPSVGLREEIRTPQFSVSDQTTQSLPPFRPRSPFPTPDSSPTGGPSPGDSPDSWAPTFSTVEAPLGPSWFAEEVTFRATGQFAESPSESTLEGYASGVEGRDFFPTAQMLDDDEAAGEIESEFALLDPTTSAGGIDVGFGDADDEGGDQSGWLW